MIEEFFGQDNVDANDTEYVVKLDDFYVHNKRGDKHLIKGMYLRFEYYTLEDMHYLKRLQGLRAIQSNIEWYTSFTHPHLPTRRINAIEFENFCKGDGAFGMQYAQVNSGVTEDEMYAFLMHLRYFLTYQDDSNPYTRIENVFPVTTPPEYSYFPQLRDTLYSYPQIQKLIFDKDYQLVDNKHNHDLLLEIYEGSAPTCHYINGEYIAFNYSTSKVELDPFVVLWFKGEPVQGQIYQQETSVKPEEGSLRINPSIFKIISNELSKKLREQISEESIKTSQQETTLFINSIRQMSESDQVFMLKNL